MKVLPLLLLAFCAQVIPPTCQQVEFTGQNPNDCEYEELRAAAEAQIQKHGTGITYIRGEMRK